MMSKSIMVDQSPTRLIMRLLHITLLALLVSFTWSAIASASGLKIKEKTKYYSIKGKTAAQLASSMSEKGPYSFQHRRRAWATAGRNLRYRIWRQKKGRSCHVTKVEMELTITYTMPKPRQARQFKRGTKRTWKKMYSLLDRHERTHGKFFKRFARDAYKAVRRMPAQRNCRQLDRQAKKIVDRLDKIDGKRNDRFDTNDKRNYRRMSRLVSS